MTDYRTGDFLTDGNKLFQIVNLADTKEYALVDVNDGVAVLINETESGLVSIYESLYDCYLQCVTKDYSAAYIWL